MITNWQFLQGILKAIGLRTGAFWGWLTEPDETVQEPEHRRRARLLAGMLVLIIPLGIWIYISTLSRTLAVSDLVSALRENPALSVTPIVLIICGVAYRLSRTKRYTWGAFILIVTIYVAIFVELVNMQVPHGIVGISSYLILCILLGSLFFPIWGTLILYVACLVGIQMLPLFSVPALVADPNSLPPAFNVVFLVGAAVMMFATMRHQDLRQIQQQAQELVETTLDAARRTQAAETLAEERNLLRTLIDNIPDHIFIKNTEGQFIVNNAAHMHSLGAASQEELIGKMDADFIVQELAERYAAEERVIIQTARPLIDNEELVMDSDGREKWLITTKVPLQDAKEKIVGLVGISRDNTKRVQAEDSLKERQHLIEKVLDTEPGTVYIYDLQENQNVFVNRDWLINYGYSTEETQGDENLLAKIIHPDDLPRIITHHEQLKNIDDDKSNVDIEYRIRRKDGVWRWVQSRDTIFTRNSEGQVTQILGILHDITESKQAQDALRESERKYRQLFENMTSGFAVHEMIYDDQGKPVDYRYLEINPAFEKLTGVPVDVLLGKTVKEIMPNTEDYWIETSAKVAMTGEPTAYTNFSRELDKHYDTYLFSSEKDTFAVVFNDVTEKIKAQEEVQKLNEELKERVRELEVSNDELTQFTYTVSHDLKSPLVTIRGFLGYLEEDMASGNLERVKQDTQRIANAVDSMNKLLKDLLELSRIGRQMNPPEEVLFNEITQEVLELLHGQLEARGVTVTLSPDLPAVYGDHQRLKEVLQNLVDNAAKFMGDQPDPRIEIGQDGEEDGKPVFFVRDNGIGIALEYHERIFGLFEKLDIRDEGTGIGLALVKRIIEYHGGRIWIESEAGKGSTFYFSLPLKLAE